MECYELRRNGEVINTFTRSCTYNILRFFRFKTIFDVTVKLETYSNPLEEDADNNIVDHREIKVSRKEFCVNFKSIIKGKPEILTRSSNILHVLGSVTVSKSIFLILL